MRGEGEVRGEGEERGEGRGEGGRKEHALHTHTHTHTVNRGGAHRVVVSTSFSRCLSKPPW